MVEEELISPTSQGHVLAPALDPSWMPLKVPSRPNATLRDLSPRLISYWHNVEFGGGLRHESSAILWTHNTRVDPANAIAIGFVRVGFARGPLVLSATTTDHHRNITNRYL